MHQILTQDFEVELQHKNNERVNISIYNIYRKNREIMFKKKITKLKEMAR